jgi:putative Mn2+ efflux pump MntP/zinc transporter ZupT
MGIIEVLLLGIGLSMDAFAVSICKGLAAKKVGLRESMICGVWFGLFQGLMPFIGFVASSFFEKWISLVAPWVAFILLSIIGGNMIREAFSGEEEESNAEFGFRNMLMLAIATSIDALAVGITFVAVPPAFLEGGKLLNTVVSCCIIMICTFLISAAGVKIGQLFGTRYKAGSEVMGGTILIFIGLRTLLNSLDTSGAMQDSDTVFGMLIPVVGTLLGAAFVYAKKARLVDTLRTILAGSSAGIMLSISIWSMLEPAARGLRSASDRGMWMIFLSFCIGVCIQLLLDHLVPHTHAFVDITEGPESKLKSEVKLMLSEVIHHVPEGVALGAVYAGCFLETDWIHTSTALILAIAVAVQNFPEAIFVSLPARSSGAGTGKAFFLGVVSGVPVPLMGIIALLVIVLFPPILPYVMAMSGGAMIYTIVEEIPQMTAGTENDKGALAFVIAFAVVMVSM